LQYNAASQQLLGEQGVIGYKIPMIPTYLATKFDIDLSLINSPEEIQNLLQGAAAAALPNPNANEAPDSVEGAAMADTPEELGLEQ